MLTEFETVKTKLLNNLFRLVMLSVISVNSSFAFDIAGFEIGDSSKSFQKFEGPAKQFMTITIDKKDTIVRILYIQKNIINNEENQSYLINKICNKYGLVVTCQEALSSIEGKNNTKFTGFSFVYWNKDKTLRLSTKLKRSSIFSLVPELTIELDLMNEKFYRLIQKKEN